MSKDKTLRLVLGDQLNAGHSWFENVDDRVTYLVAEMRQETDYVVHHVQKICGFFKAMELFAKALSEAGHKVIYLTLDAAKTALPLTELVDDLCNKHSFSRFEYQRPDEYRLWEQLRRYSEVSERNVLEVDTEHFLVPFDEISDYFKPDKSIRMEAFYRKLRKRFNVLMDGDEPAGGKWNYDAQNRNKLKVADLDEIPSPLTFSNDVTDVVARLDRHGVRYFGRVEQNLEATVTRRQARKLLKFFCNQCLPLFGRFQDAMTSRSPHSWSLYHSRLSFAMNAKMISPQEVISAAIDEHKKRPKDIPLASVEGFVRQILGWREYMRGMYWINMPQYATLNEFAAERALPEFFWTGKTRMNCVSESVNQSLEHAYAHHIQRLMITGNFCLLTGINPDEVDQWYLGIYNDAIEWVEMPNTRGMSLFADGGLIASKPYAASGAYVNRMSDYCSDCSYNVKQKHTEDACPFNSLYWNFMHEHRKRFEKNPRIGMIYRNFDKMDDELKEATLARAQKLLGSMDKL
ncbi:MAG: cryptochrome/photolyase family protein [Gammaproteobacteria bacterium]